MTAGVNIIEPCARCGRPDSVVGALVCAACAVALTPAPRPYGAKPLWAYWPDADAVATMVDAAIAHEVAQVTARAAYYAKAAGMTETEAGSYTERAASRCRALWAADRSAAVPSTERRRAALRVVMGEKAALAGRRSPSGLIFQGVI